MGPLRRVSPAAAVFVFAFFVYTACAYPGFAPRDSADLALAALHLGVAHPPGYPLYAILGRAWLALLPWGAPAWRLNLLSAAAGALAAALLAKACERHGRAAALGAGCAFAFCLPLWKFSLLEEMYSLQAAFMGALLFLSEGSARTFTRRAALSGLLFGLGCVNHQTFVLSAPAWLWLWLGEARRHGLPFSGALRAAIPFSAGGLLLDSWVPLRLGSWSAGWAALSRAEYGTLTLSATLAKPFAQAAPGLLAQFASSLAWAGSPAALLCALAGLVALRGSPRFGGVLLGLLGSLAFVLLSRLDVSSWIASTILETAFIVPLFWLCAAAAAGVELAGARAPELAGLLAAALAVWPLAAHAAGACHRDDFSAVDYARNLRLTLPPGAAAVVRGDTAVFSLRLTAPDRLVVSLLEPDWGQRLSSAAAEGRPVYAVGMPVASFKKSCPAGLALSLDGRCADPWPLYAIRMGRALSERESYARDPALAYAVAHAAAEKLARSDAEATYHALWAAAWDPEDFSLLLLAPGRPR